MPYGQSADQPLPRLPLVVPLESRFGSLGTDAQLINAFAEKDESGEYEVYKREGVTTYFTATGYPGPPVSPPTVPQGLGAFVGNGLPPTPYWLVWYSVAVGAPINARENLVYINGVYAFSTGPNTGASAAPFYGTVVPTINNTAIMFNAGNPYISTFNYTTPALTGTAIVPTSTVLVPGAVWLDQTLYVMDTSNNIWGSNLGDTTTWSSSNFINAGIIAGVAIALASHKSLVVALKSWSTEFFYDAGNAVGSPLLPVPNSAISWGCVDGKTVQNVDDKLYWLATSEQTSFFIAQMENRQISNIATPGVERLLSDATGPFYSFSMKDMGHTFYGITCIGSNITLVYDIGQKIWYVWTDPNGNYWPWWGFVTTQYGGVPLILCLSLFNSLGLQVFKFDELVYTDTNGTTGVVFPTDIYTPNYDSGSRRKDALQRMDFLADQQPGFLKIRFNDDDYNPRKWSQFRSVDLNVRRPTLTKCGSFRRRAWHLRWAEPYPLRLEAVELDIMPGTA